MTLHHAILEKIYWTLRKKVSENLVVVQNGPLRARRSVVRHLEKILTPLGIGSLTIMTVMQDGPSRARLSVVEVIDGYLEKINWNWWDGPHDGPSRPRRSVDGVSFCPSVTELGMLLSSLKMLIEKILTDPQFLTQLPSILAIPRQ